MSFEGLFIGIVGLVLGAAFTFGGFRWFMVLLPIWGMFAGFTAGADAVSVLVGEGFLASVLGIGVGIAVAIVFALLSWFYWWGAVVVVAGWIGYEAAHWLLVVIGLNPGGLVVFLISLAIGAVVAFIALALNAPKLVAITITAIAGAGWMTAGIALLPGIIKPDQLANGPIAAIYTQGWLWILIWGVLAAAGIIEQLVTTAKLEQDVAALYASRRPA
ncbi:MAG: hypothetical protein U0838_00830 [Chloroflexota bacterium]